MIVINDIGTLKNPYIQSYNEFMAEKLDTFAIKREIYAMLKMKTAWNSHVHLELVVIVIWHKIMHAN